MADALIQASKEGNIDKLYELIKEDAAVLKPKDDIMFEDTPLHIAASAGQTCYAMEVMNLMPFFARKLNKDGLSPMHLALSKGNSELVLLLLRADQELVRVKGRGGITPLHYATQSGNFHLLAIFLAACPMSIEDVTVQSETAFHIAVKNNMVEALEVLVGWLQRVCHPNAFSWNKNIPNWRDKNGHTVLHIAVSNMQIGAIRLLAEINAKNNEGLTASRSLLGQTKLSRRLILQILCRARVSKASLPKSTKTLANYLRSNTEFNEKIAAFISRLRMKISEDLRSAVLVFAGVVMAATFQAVFSPPGGVRQENANTIILINGTSITTVSKTTANGGSPSNDAGKTVMDSGSFMMFSGVNSLVLCIVFCMIVLLLPDCAYVIVAPFVLLLYFVMCYGLSIFIISPTAYAKIFNAIWLASLSLLLVFFMEFCRRGIVKIEQIRYRADKWPEEDVAEEVDESGARTTTNESGAQAVTSP